VQRAQVAHRTTINNVYLLRRCIGFFGGSNEFCVERGHRKETIRVSILEDPSAPAFFSRKIWGWCTCTHSIGQDIKQRG